ncbi:MAG: SusD/RagB family nutrient-binding outer membrane lipoprotein [Flavobacteriaceae bacterium]
MMKNTIKNIFAALLVLTLITACNEDFLDVNNDPNNPTSVSLELALPVAQTYTASSIYGSSSGGNGRQTNTIGNLYMYNWSQAYGFSWYLEEFQYLVAPSFYEQIWDWQYQNVLKQYNVLDVEGEGTSNNYFRAISKIMKSFHFQVLVDMYGDIPYTEALQRGGNITPAFDDAEKVYDDLIAQINTAIEMINNAGADTINPGDQDVMFGGDMDDWVDFANTVKMRILIRQSGMASKQDFINAEFAKIDSWISADVAINPGYINEEGKQNPMWAYNGADVAGTVTLTNDATCATQYVLDYLSNTNDPRIDYLYEKPTGGHLGVEQGYVVDDSYSADKVSNVGPGVLVGFDQDAIIFSLAEAYFLLAEARDKGYVSGDAKAAYDAGIAASFATLGATQGTYTGDTDWNTKTKLEAIITQKWIALNGTNGIESWFEYNRTGFPSGLPVSNQSKTADRPVRHLYPNSEISANASNVPAQKNAFTNKIFWAN